MKITYWLLAVGALALCGCQNMSSTPAAPSGGSAGAMGEGYCQNEPADPDDLDQWNDTCMPDRR